MWFNTHTYIFLLCTVNAILICRQYTRVYPDINIYMWFFISITWSFEFKEKIIVLYTSVWESFTLNDLKFYFKKFLYVFNLCWHSRWSFLNFYKKKMKRKRNPDCVIFNTLSNAPRTRLDFDLFSLIWYLRKHIAYFLISSR